MLRQAAVTACALGALGLVAGPLRAEDPPTPPDVPEAAATGVAHAWATWIAAFERGDADALAGLFTEDGIYAANTGEVLRGRAAIRDGVRASGERQSMFLEALGFAADSALDVEEAVLSFRRGGDDTVYRLSRFLVLVLPSRCALDAGHLLGVWRQGADGEWRLESLLGNRDRRPPRQACGTRGSAPG